MDQEVCVKLTKQGIKTLLDYLKCSPKNQLSLVMKNYIFSGLNKEGFYTSSLSLVAMLFGEDLEQNQNIEYVLSETKELSSIR